MSKKSWIADISEADDGTGDAILTFPDDMLAETGWTEGTLLDLKVEETPSGKILIITEVKNESV